MDDKRTQEYFTVIDEITLEEDIDHTTLIQQAPKSFREIVKTSAQIRFLDSLEDEKKVTTINKMVDTLWSYGIDTTPSIQYVMENEHSRAADYYKTMMFCMIGKQIITNTRKEQQS